MRDLYVENGGVIEEWNHIHEFKLARELVKRVGAHMGRRYGFVAERCFEGTLAIDVAEVTDTLLQSAFYEKVECELKECMEAF